MRKIGIIGGSGVYNAHIFSGFQSLIVSTPYGEVSCLHGFKYGNEVTFITRHGEGHLVPPHLINYRANIWAFKKIGVQEIVATAACGSLNESMRPGTFVVCDQLLDFTKTRVNTFFDGKHYPVGHVDFTNPYCPALREVLICCLETIGVPLSKRGTMVVTEGPRFETPAEIKMFVIFGGDLVNMTNVPECVLAREAEMHYATVAVVTNMAAGISQNSLGQEEVLECMAQSSAQINELMERFIAYDGWLGNCDCADAMRSVGGFKV